MWRENAPAVRLFDAMSTQWRWSEGRRRGLDLGALPGVWMSGQWPRAERPAALRGLAVMEDEALRCFAKG